MTDSNIVYSSNASLSLKITAATDTADRASFIATRIATGIKSDGTVKHSLVNWMLKSNYTVGKLSNFSLFYQEFTGKQKGEFIEVTRFIPSKKSGLTIKFLPCKISQEAIKTAIFDYINLNNAKVEVERGNLPRQFYLLVYAFNHCLVQTSEDAESLSVLSSLDDSFWKTAQDNLIATFPAFYGLSCQGLPLSQPKPIAVIEAVKIVEGKPETLESLSKIALQQRKDLETPKASKASKASKVAEVATV